MLARTARNQAVPFDSHTGDRAWLPHAPPPAVV